MNEIFDILKNDVLITSLIGWFAAQFLKVVFVLVFDKKFDIRRFVGSGGMPSSHSSFVVSLAVYTGLKDGFSSTAFAVCFVLAFVIMYDAAGVRRAAGIQAKILNQIIENWQEPAEIKGKRLKELLGHTPFEVLAGAAVGIAVAIICYFAVFN